MNNAGGVVCNAHKIIFPGIDGNSKWDCAQLLEQMEESIPIFEAAHLDKQALFVFDQSSAHVSLTPSALKAFEMNKSDRGKQHLLQDTIIPIEKLLTCMGSHRRYL